MGEQVEMDTRDLEEKILTDTVRTMLRSMEDNPNIQFHGAHNRHEAYGVIAEYFDKLQKDLKEIKKACDEFLENLPRFDKDMSEFSGHISQECLLSLYDLTEFTATARMITSDLHRYESLAKAMQ